MTHHGLEPVWNWEVGIQEGFGGNFAPSENIDECFAVTKKRAKFLGRIPEPYIGTGLFILKLIEKKSQSQVIKGKHLVLVSSEPFLALLLLLLLRFFFVRL